MIQVLFKVSDTVLVTQVLVLREIFSRMKDIAAEIVNGKPALE